jgi:hypothetical protein
MVQVREFFHAKSGHDREAVTALTERIPIFVRLGPESTPPR